MHINTQIQLQHSQWAFTYDIDYWPELFGKNVENDVA